MIPGYFFQTGCLIFGKSQFRMSGEAIPDSDMQGGILTIKIS